MPGKSKGGKHFKRKKGQSTSKRELELKQEGQQYAIIAKMLGQGRLMVNCMDGTKRMAKIRGTLRRKCWMYPGDLILVGLRQFDNNKCDVQLKYNPDEVRQLKALGQIQQNIQVNEDNEGISFTGQRDMQGSSDSSSDGDDDEIDEQPQLLKQEDVDDI